MRQKQDQDKRDLVEAQRCMSSIEAAAKRQYEEDQRAAQEVQKQRLGEWVSVHVAQDLRCINVLQLYQAACECYVSIQSALDHASCSMPAGPQLSANTQVWLVSGRG